MVNQPVKVGVANNDKRAKCWCGTGKVGVATVTPAIRHSPPMFTVLNRVVTAVGAPCRAGAPTAGRPRPAVGAGDDAPGFGDS